MCNHQAERNMETIDSLTLNKFIEKFNEKYAGSFLNEQETLLNAYITSFVDNGVALKMFLNEEISRLKKLISNAPAAEEIKNDPDMVEKINKIDIFLETFKSSQIDDRSLFKIMKTQELVKEIYADAG
jgi:hypothetical protein